MRVAFVFTNPRHHLEMMAPVARALEQRGTSTTLVSLAELRGFDTPMTAPQVVRALPFNLRGHVERLRTRVRPPAAVTHVTSSGLPASQAVASPRRRLAQRIVWAALRPRLRACIAGADVVVVPNDAVYPYVDLLALARAEGARTALMQEGIRFPMPTPEGVIPYGGGDVDLVCAWGEGSRDHFIRQGVPSDRIQVTGSPRSDGLDVARWQREGTALRARMGSPGGVIAFCSNPIELQGYGSTAAKLARFRDWLEGSADLLDREQVTVLVKPHPSEDASAFARAAGTTRARGLVRLVPDEATFGVLGAARAAVVLSSTVGLEALVLGVPLGQLLPAGFPPPFEYVAAGVAMPLEPGPALVGQMQALLASSVGATGRAFVERHLHARGHAAEHTAAALGTLLARAQRRV